METRNNETVDDMEYQQNDEQLIHIFDLHTVGLYSVYLILFIQFHVLPRTNGKKLFKMAT